MKNISQFIPKNYRQFHKTSMIELMQALKTLPTVWSWGANGWVIAVKDKMLRFTVQARRHKGFIYLAVNAFDLFDIFLTDVEGNITKTFTDVFVDDLVPTIDKEIEYISEYTF